MVMRHKPGLPIVWALLESGGISLFSLVTLFVLARLVGPSDFGVAALALGVVQILTLIVEMLLHDAIVQRPDLGKEHLDTAFWTSLGLGVLLFGVCVVGGGLFAELLDAPSLDLALEVAGVGLIFSGIGCVPVAILRRDLHLRPIALRALYGKLGGGIAGITLALQGYGLWSLIVQHLIQVSVMALVVWSACAWRPRLRFHPSHLRTLLSFGVLSVGSRLVWLASIRLFTVLVGYFLGVVAAGYWSIALRVVDTLHDLLSGAAYNLALPLFSRRQDDRSALARGCRAATELGALSALPLFGGLAVCAPRVVDLLLGATWMGAAPVVRVLAAAAAIQFVFLFATAAITAIGRPGLIFALSVVSFAFATGGMFLIRPEAVIDAAFLWVSRVAVTAPLLLLMMRQLFGVPALELLKDAPAPLAATVLMAVVLLGLEQHFLSGVSSALALAVLVPTGAAVYLIIVGLAGPRGLRRLFELAAGSVRGLRTS